MDRLTIAAYWVILSPRFIPPLPRYTRGEAQDIVYSNVAIVLAIAPFYFILVGIKAPWHTWR